MVMVHLGVARVARRPLPSSRRSVRGRGRGFVPPGEVPPLVSRSGRSLHSLFVAVVAAALVVPTPVAAADPAAKPTVVHGAAGHDRSTTPVRQRDAREPERVIVKYRAGVSGAERSALRAANRVRAIHGVGLVRTEVVRPTDGRSVAETVAALRRDPRVEYAVPDYYRRVASNPWEEPLFGEQWGLHNTGQEIDGWQGLANVDIDGREAFSRALGDPSVVVAVIDSGVDFTHPDLAGQEWVNSGESGVDDNGVDRATNGFDDDGNGYVDDVNGWDFCNDDNTVHDLDMPDHGTNVAGIVAAKVNGVGITGVAPGVKIMALKFLQRDEDDGCNLDSQAIDAIAYAKANGADVINASWGGTQVSAALKDAIDEAGLLFVAAAGNAGTNNDLKPFYPAAFPSTNILAVASIDNAGARSGFSNYGATSVDLSAPGERIVVPMASTSHDPAGWAIGDGTSYAAPHVAGVAALVASLKPGLAASAATLKQRLMDTTWYLSSTDGETVTSGVVDALFAVDFVRPTVTAPTVSVVAPTSLGSTTMTARISWAKPTDDSGYGTTWKLQQRVNGGAWTTVSGTTGVTAINRSLTIGAKYEFRVRAEDVSANTTWGPSAAAQATRSQETSTAIAYGGTWTRTSSPGASGGYTRYASRAGRSATFKFTGRGVQVVAPKSAGRGSVKVYVDGAYVKTISLYSRTSLARQVVYGRNWTSNATHTVKLVVIGTAGHPRVDVDAFVVLR